MYGSEKPIDEREQLVNRGLDYLNELLATANINNIEKEKFSFLFQIYLLYELTAIAHGLLLPDNSPAIKQVHANQALRQNFIKNFVNIKGVSNITFGEFFRQLFNSQLYPEFVEHLKNKDINKLHRYALSQAKEEFHSALQAK